METVLRDLVRHSSAYGKTSQEVTWGRPGDTSDNENRRHSDQKHHANTTCEFVVRQILPVFLTSLPGLPLADNHSPPSFLSMIIFAAYALHNRFTPRPSPLFSYLFGGPRPISAGKDGRLSEASDPHLLLFDC